MVLLLLLMCCFFKQKTAYEMRISDWSSDVCSSDLFARLFAEDIELAARTDLDVGDLVVGDEDVGHRGGKADQAAAPHRQFEAAVGVLDGLGDGGRSEEHTSELQSLMRISYAVLCLKKKRRGTYTNKRIKHMRHISTRQHGP